MKLPGRGRASEGPATPKGGTRRAALGWGVRELAAKAGTGIKSVSRFENGGDVRKSTVDKWQLALEAEGVTFENSARPGIHWTAS